MDSKRRGEIAYALWKYRLKKEGIHLGDVNREIGNIAKATSISQAELREFVQQIASELLTETFEKAAE